MREALFVIEQAHNAPLLGGEAEYHPHIINYDLAHPQKLPLPPWLSFNADNIVLINIQASATAVL